MNIATISDDTLFSLGLCELFREYGYSTLAVGVSDFLSDKINFKLTDVIFVDVAACGYINHDIVPEYYSGAIIFVFDLPVELINKGSCCISKKDKVSNYLKILKSLQRYPQLTLNELIALKFYNNGIKREAIASFFNLTIQSVYRIQKNCTLKCGFTRFHPVIARYCEGIILCTSMTCETLKRRASTSIKTAISTIKIINP